MHYSILKRKQVTVELSESAAQVKITIEDHGIGIPAKNFHIFSNDFIAQTNLAIEKQAAWGWLGNSERTC